MDIAQQFPIWLLCVLNRLCGIAISVNRAKFAQIRHSRKVKISQESFKREIAAGCSTTWITC